MSWNKAAIERNFKARKKHRKAKRLNLRMI